MIKIGLGVDIHPFVKGRPCILGGVRIPYSRGLKGHSDADALTHALIDALLGALGERDIGYFFPDTDARWKNADSLKMLAMVQGILKKKKAVIHNLDITVITQEPRLAPHIMDIKTNLSKTLCIKPSQVAIKATSSEWMGFTGRKEGIVVLATACMDSP